MKNLSEKNQKPQTEKPDNYIAPEIEVIEVEIEQGFQASGPSRPGGPSW